MTPVFGYIRVSTTKQLDGEGPARQQEQIARYCAQRGLFVQRWFTDDVTGTSSAADRRQFCEMISLMGDATTKTIVVESADRLARDLIVSELAIQEARSRGFKILEARSDTDLTDSSDPTRVVIRQVLGALAEWNKSTMVLRLRDARERKRARGERCEGRKPFASRSEYDAETWALMTGWRRAGWSFGQIQRELNKQGRRTPQGKTHAAGNYYWYRSSVAKMLTEHEARSKKNGTKLELVEGLGV